MVRLKSGKKIRADAFLWANGRTGNTDSLGLENIGLEANGRGQLSVDEHYRTSIPHIYAAGDVIGWPSLASAAYDQGLNSCNELLEKSTALSAMCRPVSIPFLKSAPLAPMSAS
ncbi:hypothetical protein HAALTHF_40960n [Vreelandella aquamarina]|nr:hypothetical protein HAALTHF_40960n [Halomonas axialensis]